MSLEWLSQVADSVADSAAAQDLLQGKLLVKIVELHERCVVTLRRDSDAGDFQPLLIL